MLHHLSRQTAMGTRAQKKRLRLSHLNRHLGLALLLSPALSLR